LVRDQLPLFDYFVPNTLEEALARVEKDGYILAGGTDIIVAIKESDLKPACLVSTRKLDQLKYVHFNNSSKTLKVGALTTIRELEDSRVVRARFPILAEAAKNLAHPQIRNKATIGGNLCNASPCADTSLPALVYDAELELASTSGSRRVRIEDFFIGPGETCLKRGEMLCSISMKSKPNSKGVFIKLGRRGSRDLAIVSTAILLTLKKNSCKDAKIALGSVAPTPIRAKKAESILNGNILTEKLIEKAASAACDDAKPVTDVRASANYRSEMVRVLTKRGILSLVGREKRIKK
jgi:carbon-monoxide dehydrogenase medium subunit